MRIGILFCSLLPVVVVVVAFLASSSLAQSNVICPSRGRQDNSTRLIGYDPTRPFTEISGLVFSPTKVVPSTGNPILYAINDGHDKLGQGRIGVFDSGTGQRLVTLTISNTTIASHYDWEAIAMGPCGSSGSGSNNGVYTASATVGKDGESSSSCLYIGDTGDNPARELGGRKSGRSLGKHPYRIIKLQEPNLDAFLKASVTAPPNSREAPAPELEVEGHLISWINFDYNHPTSPTIYADSEAIFVDPVGWGKDGAMGDVYVVTKWNNTTKDWTRLFKIPANIPWSMRSDQQSILFSPYSPEAVSGGPSTTTTTTGRQGSEELFQSIWTEADITPDGTILALSTQETTTIFLRCPGSTVAETLVHESSCTSWKHPGRGQVETVAFSPDLSRVLTIPEGPRPRMGWTDVHYLDNHTNACPNLEWVYLSETGQSYCRTAGPSSRKLPKERCSALAGVVPVVILEEEDLMTVIPQDDVAVSAMEEEEDTTNQADGSSAMGEPGFEEGIAAEQEEEEEEEQGPELEWGKREQGQESHSKAISLQRVSLPLVLLVSVVVTSILPGSFGCV